MKFIQAKKEHYQVICALIETEAELFLAYPKGRFPLDEVQLAHLAETREALTVVIEAGKVIGFANLYNIEPGRRAFIGNVVVSPRHRGQGIGKRLVGHMLNIVFSRYANEAHISVFGYNAPALLMYAALGFRLYGVEARRTPGNEKAALIHMKLESSDMIRLSDDVR